MQMNKAQMTGILKQTEHRNLNEPRPPRHAERWSESIVIALSQTLKVQNFNRFRLK
jgi:hypothetical protein